MVCGLVVEHAMPYIEMPTKKNHKHQQKKWRENNAFEFAEMKKKWRLANLEKCKAQRIENYNANKERELASARKYKK